MYFWDSRRLAVDLRNDAVSPTQLKNYLIALFILGLPTGLVHLGFTREERLSWLLALTISATATVVGLHLAFKANGGSGGERFIQKVVALMLPLTIQMMVLIALLMIALVIAASPLELDASGTPKLGRFTEQAVDVIVHAAMPWLMWRLVVHMPDTVHSKPEHTPSESAGTAASDG
jgi:hypothetical protein